MEPLPQEDRARIARAMWAYSNMSQADLARAAGIHQDRMRALLARTNPAEATLDELVAIAEALGVSTRFAIEGFAAVLDPADLEVVRRLIMRLTERLAKLEREVAATQQPQAGGLPTPGGDVGRSQSDDQTTLQDPSANENRKEEGPQQGAA